MHQIRRRLTFANVVSCIALFVALGGASYAAVTLPKNSVGSKQIKKNAVTAAKIKKNSVNSSKVKNHSLKAVDFKPGQLPEGPQGKEGPEGPQGPSGATSVVMRTGPAFTVERNWYGGGAAECNPGERATGGGVYPNQSVYYSKVVASFPTPNTIAFSEHPNDGITPTGWRVWVGNPDTPESEAPPSVELTPYVICVAP